jgi:hypothetical protein
MTFRDILAGLRDRISKCLKVSFNVSIQVYACVTFNDVDLNWLAIIVFGERAAYKRRLRN